MAQDRTLSAGFLRTAELHPSRPALEVAGETVSYAELHNRATWIAAALGEPPLTAVLAARSVTAYAAVLGALLAGHGHVPLNPRFPPRRNAAMLRRSGCRTLVAGDDLREVAPGEDGELLVAGPQVTAGYLDDPERTAESFVTPPGRGDVHYRTGDRVRNGAPLIYLGRVDDQIKVLGHRVELGEVEAALRSAASVDEAVALGWPRTPSGAGGIVAFLPDPHADSDALRRALADELPDYMVPRRFELREELPLNASGKLDRMALLASLD
jgi:acyl-CoA synthetase (AMP-forming)/AMP-acid ligase II